MTEGPHIVTVDTREQTLEVQGQELMTQDKVSLRLNLSARTQVTEPLLLEQLWEYGIDMSAGQRPSDARRPFPVPDMRNEQSHEMPPSVATRTAKPRVRESGTR